MIYYIIPGMVYEYSYEWHRRHHTPFDELPTCLIVLDNVKSKNAEHASTQRSRRDISRARNSGPKSISYLVLSCALPGPVALD